MWKIAVTLALALPLTGGDGIAVVGAGRLYHGPGMPGGSRLSQPPGIRLRKSGAQAGPVSGAARPSEVTSWRSYVDTTSLSCAEGVRGPLPRVASCERRKVHPL